MAHVPLYRSLFGRIAGFDVNNDLVIKDRHVTDLVPAIGAKVGATVTAKEFGNGVFNRTELTFTATPIAITDEGGVSQWGGIEVYDFPAGLIITLGAIVSGTMTLGTTGTIINTWAGICSLGSVIASATGAASLVTTAATWLQQVSIGAATLKVATIDAVSVATQLVEAPARAYDGTDAAGKVWFNYKVTDDGTHTSGTGTFTGTIKFNWANLGDN